MPGEGPQSLCPACSCCSGSSFLTTYHRKILLFFQNQCWKQDFLRSLISLALSPPHTHAYMHSHAHTRTHHTNTHSHTHALIRTHTCNHTHTHMQVCMCACAPTHIHTHSSLPSALYLRGSPHFSHPPGFPKGLGHLPRLPLLVFQVIITQQALWLFSSESPSCLLLGCPLPVSLVIWAQLPPDPAGSSASRPFFTTLPTF